MGVLKYKLEFYYQYKNHVLINSESKKIVWYGSKKIIFFKKFKNCWSLSNIPNCHLFALIYLLESINKIVKPEFPRHLISHSSLRHMVARVVDGFLTSLLSGWPLSQYPPLFLLFLDMAAPVQLQLNISNVAQSCVNTINWRIVTMPRNLIAHSRIKNGDAHSACLRHHVSDYIKPKMHVYSGSSPIKFTGYPPWRKSEMCSRLRVSQITTLCEMHDYSSASPITFTGPPLWSKSKTSSRFHAFSDYYLIWDVRFFGRHSHYVHRTPTVKQIRDELPLPAASWS
jgi:hypothetical protein